MSQEPAGIEFGASFELFFIVLFVYAGANLHVTEILEQWPAVLVFVGARAAAIASAPDRKGAPRAATSIAGKFQAIRPSCGR